VTITNSTVAGAGRLIQADAGAQVTLSHIRGNGGSGYFFAASNIKSLTLRNCTIHKTSGIYIHEAEPGAAISIIQNRQRNIQTPGGPRSFAQFDHVTTATIDVSWNEIINDFGHSAVEGDLISVYDSAFAKIHDNYIQGAYASRARGAFSGSGIMIEAVGSHDNEVYSNQIVETTNAGIGVAEGRRNVVHGNKLIFDGKLADGRRLLAANVGIYVWNSHHDPRWGDNQAYGNTVGWVNAAGKRNDWWLPDCSLNCGNRAFAGVLSDSSERAVYRAWLAKLSVNGIRLGA
jgi:hypothetical protein